MKINFKFSTRGSWSSSLLANVLLLFLIGGFLVSAANICDDAKYSNGSKFESNLNTVLNNLVQHTSSSGGYNTSVFGQSPDRIYGLLQCRGDTSAEECYNFSLQANTSIRQDCGNAIGATVWLDKCFLRYENYTFFGVLNTDSRVLYRTDSAIDPDAFGRAIRGIFKNLSDAAPSSPKRYASGTTYDPSSFNTIYGLVQCWMDINIDDCKTCLRSAISTFLRVTNGTHLGGVSLLRSCIARVETYTFFTPAPPPPPSPPSLSPPLVGAPADTPRSTQSKPTSKKKSPNRTAIIVGVLGGLVLMLLLVSLFARRKFFKSALYGKQMLIFSSYEGDRHTEEGSLQDHRIVFNLETLREATRNFHHDNKLGEGGFGAVYKGTMPDGKEIAVKRLSPKSMQGRKEFVNEVKFMAKVRHRNLVNLLGCCAEGSERLLVYEYLPKKSLDKILFDTRLVKQLGWQTRFNIIIGIARGLVYMHEDCEIRIIHRDIKASNILLDGKMNPKIADFGLARLFPEDETHVSTLVAGTYGYMAPEYAMNGQLSDKADVYSFGVLLLEIVCGRKNTDFKLPLKFQNLLELVWRLYSRGKIVDVLDRGIVESYQQEQASRCIHVGLLCTQANVSRRPMMSRVYSMLSNPSISNLPDATKPAFVNVTSNPAQLHPPTSTTSTSMSSSTSSGTPLVHASVNDASVTDCVAR